MPGNAGNGLLEWGGTTYKWVVCRVLTGNGCRWEEMTGITDGGRECSCGCLGMVGNSVF